MTYPQAVEYLYERLPMFHRVGPAAYKANLDNTIRLMEVLGKPHLRVKCIHVAGTNGKGSCSHMLAAILQQAGYTTGLYTSPHLVDFRERVRINGKLVPKNTVVDFIEAHRETFEEIKPSFFEWTFAFAMDYFASQEVDVAVIETGLGGRLDSTNVIQPKVCLITNIGLDHTNLLGDTLEAIAKEKAGIIKPKTPVVIGQYQSESASIFSAVARELKAPIEFADKNYRVVGTKQVKGLLTVEVLDRRDGQTEHYELDLTGNYQAKNLLGVLDVIGFIEKAGYVVEKAHVKKALRQVIRMTGLAGRWQVISKRPLTIADSAHNTDGLKQALESIRSTPHRRLHVVFGAVGDKDINSMLALLPPKAIYYFVNASLPRALAAKELCEKAKRYKLHGKAFTSVKEGIKSARKAAGKDDLVFIGGSIFVVGEALG